MSPTPETAREPRYKIRGSDWYQPPPGTPLGSAVPYAVGSYADAHTPLQEKILALLKSKEHGGEKRDDMSFSNRNAPSCEDMASILDVDRSTVSRNIQELTAKKAMQVTPLMSGGRRMGTEYFIYCYEDALKARRNAPAIARREDGKLLIIGRGKHLMTTEQAKAWGIKLYAESAPAAVVDEPENTNSAPKKQESMNETTAVAKALRDGTKGVSKELAADYLRQARAAAAARTPPAVIELEQILGVIAETRALAKNRTINNPGYFMQTLKQRVTAYLDAVEDARLAEADAAARETWVPRADCDKCRGVGYVIAVSVVRGTAQQVKQQCECFAPPMAAQLAG